MHQLSYLIIKRKSSYNRPENAKQNTSMASTSASRTPPLGKYLSSTGTPMSLSIFFLLIISSDKKTRDKAVKNLAAFLSDPDRPHISNHEMDKLWKGIFYCETQSQSESKHDWGF
jgi:hypothetical protein